jgi:hypothetical protein
MVFLPPQGGKILIAQRAIPPPLNLLNLLNPLNPHAAGVSKKKKKQLTRKPIHGIIIPVAARAAAPMKSSFKKLQKSA